MSSLMLRDEMTHSDFYRPCEIIDEIPDWSNSLTQSILRSSFEDNPKSRKSVKELSQLSSKNLTILNHSRRSNRYDTFIFLVVCALYCYCMCCTFPLTTRLCVLLICCIFTIGYCCTLFGHLVFERQFVIELTGFLLLLFQLS